MKRSFIEFVVKWWGPVLLAILFINFTSIMDAKQYRWVIHTILMIQGICLWEMAKDYDRIKLLCSKEKP
jgi:hypothetical protein